MADRVQKKYALIINGDTEPRHLRNVDVAIAALKKEDPQYQISLLSTRRPQGSVTQYVEGGAGALRKLVEGLSAKMDRDDLLLVYVTGHGKEGVKNEGCIGLSDGCYSLADLKKELAKVPHGNRIVVMDQCFSGKGFSFFADRKTIVVTQGSPNEVVSCQLFSPYFWSDRVKDGDGDGVVTVQERYAHAIAVGKTPSLTQYFSEGLSISLSGKRDRTAPFPSKVVKVHQDPELRQQLKRLQPGQLALVMFSADWCQPCKVYFPTFEKLAQKYGGRFLAILAEEIKTDMEWNKFGTFNTLPTVAFIDFRGKVTVVEDPHNPLASLIRASLYNLEQEISMLRNDLKNPDPKIRALTLKSIMSLREQAAPLVPRIIPLLTSKDLELRYIAMQALAAIGIPSKQAVRPMLAMLQPSFFHELVAWDIEKIGTHFLGLREKIFDFYWTLGVSLAAIGQKDPSFLPQLVAVLKNPKTNKYAKAAALKAIEGMGAKGVQAYPVLLQYAMHNEFMDGIGLDAYEAIIKIAKVNPEMISTLVREVADKQLHPYHRYYVSLMIFNRLIEELSAEHLADLIRVAMDDTNPATVRSIAAKIIYMRDEYPVTPENYVEARAALRKLAENYPGDLRNEDLNPPAWFSQTSDMIMALSLIEDRSPRVRLFGTAVLIGALDLDQTKFKHLLSLSRDPDVEVRRLAAFGLGDIKSYRDPDKKLLPLIESGLIALLRDKDTIIQLMAFTTLLDLKKVMETDWPLIRKNLLAYLSRVEDEKVLEEAMDYARKKNFPVPEEIARRKKHWTLGVAPLLDFTFGEGAGLGAMAHGELRFDRWGFQAQLSASRSAEQGLRLSGGLAPLYYFRSRSSLGAPDPYLLLPGFGVTAFPEAGAKFPTAFTLYSGGFGMRWYVWNQLSFDGSLQGRADFPLSGEKSRLGLQSQIGMALGL